MAKHDPTFSRTDEKKRKRDDDEIEKEMAQVKRIGKRVKKATRKDKGKLGELVEEIDKREPTREIESRTGADDVDGLQRYRARDKGCLGSWVSSENCSHAWHHSGYYNEGDSAC